MLGNVPYNIILSNIKNNISSKWMVTFNTVYLNLHAVFCQSDEVNGLNDMTPNRLWKDNVLSRYMLFVNKNNKRPSKWVLKNIGCLIVDNWTKILVSSLLNSRIAIYEDGLKDIWMCSLPVAKM
jgi:hypothetical protein